MADLERRTVLFSGEVQGVGFRATTARLAAELPITGTVRNLADGRVELVAESSVEVVNQLVKSLNDHFGSGITESASTRSPATGEFTDFRIRY